MDEKEHDGRQERTTHRLVAFFFAPNSNNLGWMLSAAHCKQICGFLLATLQNNVCALKVQPNRVGKKILWLNLCFSEKFFAVFCRGSDL